MSLQTYKAAYRSQYCPPEAIEIRELTRRNPVKDEIEIKVMATTVNRTDYGVLTANYAIMRVFTGLLRPKQPVPGTDLAGIVEAVGPEVKHLKPGDRVWAFNDNGLGTQAEYAYVSEKEPIDRIPEGLDFATAVACFEGAHYACNYIHQVKPGPGTQVLVNGATGAIGSAILQFYKYFGAEVTAVCGTAHIDLIKELGADHIIDYQKDDFTRHDGAYDIIMDAVGKSRFKYCKPLLKPDGAYMSTELGKGIENPVLALTTSIFGKKKVHFPVPVDIRRTMKFVTERLADGSFRPLIDRHYGLNQIREAYTYVNSGQKIGNVILNLSL
jgi:NADPH:quinone reductase-like Zn-dependent oxidoreductase